MSPTLTKALREDADRLRSVRAALALTGGLPDGPTPTEGLPDAPTRTEGLPDAPTPTEGLPDAPTSPPTGTLRKIQLTDEIREFIVRGLARFDTPSQVAASVREFFGIEVSRQLVYKYDPFGRKPPARRWIDLHAATRARFLADLAEIGVAQKTVRLRMLDHFARNAEENHFYIDAAVFLEQAAKECGGIYESRRRRATAP